MEIAMIIGTSLVIYAVRLLYITHTIVAMHACTCTNVTELNLVNNHFL